jgi:hypothetical protein
MKAMTLKEFFSAGDDLDCSPFAKLVIALVVLLVVGAGCFALIWSLVHHSPA